MSKGRARQTHHRQPVPGAAAAAPTARAQHHTATPADHAVGPPGLVLCGPGPGDPADAPARSPHDWQRRRVLLLNATYEPLNAIPARRAVVLLLGHRAEILHRDPDGPLVHSEGSAVQIPSVIRLRTFVHVPYQAKVPMTRAALMHRDGHRCAYCGGKADTIDHVVPRSRGGAHSWENCAAACARCNHRKGDRLLGELGWKLHAVLRPPSGRHWHLLSGIGALDPAWGDYFEMKAG